MFPRFVWRRFSFPAFYFHVAFAEFTFFTWYHGVAVIGSETVYFTDGRHQIVHVGFHVSEFGSHFSGTVSSFEKSPLIVHAVGVAIPPYPEALTESMGRDDMLPLQAVSTFPFFLWSIVF